jgi:ubiquinone/menaquinone biosynthesis C-methylase UbiE
MDPHKANKLFWDASTDWWKQKEDDRGIWKKAHQKPSLVFSPPVMPFVQNVKRKEVCVLGSGDNEVAFAFVGLGGLVTSVDISQCRLEVAEDRARELGLELNFVQADVTDLSSLADHSFDMVYTGGHMSVWVSDIKKYYSEAVRILKPGSIFIVDDYHPIRRMWLDAHGLEPKHDYFKRGPYEYTDDEGLKTCEFHWTTSDHIQAVLDAGCALVKVEEYGQKVEDEYWLEVNLDKFPAYLLIVGKKDQG